MSTAVVDQNDVGNAPPHRFPPSSGVRPLFICTAVLGVVTLLAPIVIPLLSSALWAEDGFPLTVWVWFIIQPVLLSVTLIVAAITACRAVRYSGTRQPLRHKLVWAWLIIFILNLAVAGWSFLDAAAFMRTEFFGFTLPLGFYTPVVVIAWVCSIAVFASSRRDAPTRPLVSAKVIITAASILILLIPGSIFVAGMIRYPPAWLL